MKVLMLGWEFPPYFAGGVGIVCYEIAKQLLIEYSAPMANQGINEEDARKILEFLRTENWKRV